MHTRTRTLQHTHTAAAPPTCGIDETALPRVAAAPDETQGQALRASDSVGGAGSEDGAEQVEGAAGAYSTAGR